jgi:hypothetical protein
MHPLTTSRGAAVRCREPHARRSQRCFAGRIFGRFWPDSKRPPPAAMAANHGVLGLVGGLREPGETNNPSVRTVEGACGRCGPGQAGAWGCKYLRPKSMAQRAL